MLRQTANLLSLLAGWVMRRRFRCPGHEPRENHRPLTCKHCWQVLEELS